MNSIRRMGRNKSTLSRFFKTAVFAGLIIALAGLYLVVNFSFGTASDTAGSNRKSVLEAAQSYIARNIPGLETELFSEQIDEDGLWRLVYRCTRERSDNSEERLTLRVFVDENTMKVWGFTSDGW